MCRYTYGAGNVFFRPVGVVESSLLCNHAAVARWRPSQSVVRSTARDRSARVRVRKSFSSPRGAREDGGMPGTHPRRRSNFKSERFSPRRLLALMRKQWFC